MDVVGSNPASAYVVIFFAPFSSVPFLLWLLDCSFTSPGLVLWFFGFFSFVFVSAAPSTSQQKMSGGKAGYGGLAAVWRAQNTGLAGTAEYGGAGGMQERSPWSLQFSVRQTWSLGMLAKVVWWRCGVVCRRSAAARHTRSDARRTARHTRSAARHTPPYFPPDPVCHLTFTTLAFHGPPRTPRRPP